MALNAKMKLAAEIMVADPEKYYVDVATEVGVDESTLWRWRKRDDFQEYEHELCLERFKDLEKLAIKKLKENAMKNNQRAVEYILDYVGFKATEQVEVSEKVINICIEED